MIPGRCSHPTILKGAAPLQLHGARWQGDLALPDLDEAAGAPRATPASASRQ